MMIMRGPVSTGIPLRIEARSVPRADEYVAESLNAGATSAWRVSA